MSPLMKSVLTFDTLHAPKLITFLYYVGLVGLLVGGISAIFAGNILQGIIGTAVGVLLVRVGCEVWMVFFKMNEALQEIRKK